MAARPVHDNTNEEYQVGLGSKYPCEVEEGAGRGWTLPSRRWLSKPDKSESLTAYLQARIQSLPSGGQGEEFTAEMFQDESVAWEDDNGKCALVEIKYRGTGQMMTLRVVESEVRGFALLVRLDLEPVGGASSLVGLQPVRFRGQPGLLVSPTPPRVSVTMTSRSMAGEGNTRRKEAFRAY